MDTQRLLTLYQQKEYDLLDVKPGQYLEIQEYVGDGDKKRVWKFRGIVLKVKKPKHADGSFTIRGTVAGITIEKIYPLSFPNFKAVNILDEYKVRRAKLYYLREKQGKKSAKLKSKRSIKKTQ